MIDLSCIKNADPELYDAMQKELVRQRGNLELIASENIVSPAVMAAMGSHFTNKYAEGYPGKRYYGGCEFVDVAEDLARNRLKKLFGCEYCNVQPHSGAQANFAVYFAMLKPGDTIMGMNLSHGGHLTHGSPVNISGLYFNIVPYGVNDDGFIDYNEVERIAKECRPKLIVAGASAYARKIDFKKFREIADKVGAFLMVDMAHIAGLVAAGYHESPIPYAHVTTTTTHKTLRGPRGGAILTNDEELYAKINKAVFPGIQGGPLMHIIAGKAVGFKENLKPEWKIYAKQVKSNIQALAEVLIKRNYELVSGGSDNHLILMSFLNKDFSGKDADLALGNAGITVNKNTIPGEIRSPFITSGIRIGSPALTARGMKEKEFEWIGEKIADILDDINNTNLQEHIKAQVKNFSRDFRIYDRPIF